MTRLQWSYTHARAVLLGDTDVAVMANWFYLARYFHGEYTP